MSPLSRGLLLSQRRCKPPVTIAHLDPYLQTPTFSLCSLPHLCHHKRTFINRLLGRNNNDRTEVKQKDNDAKDQDEQKPALKRRRLPAEPEPEDRRNTGGLASSSIINEEQSLREQEDPQDDRTELMRTGYRIRRSRPELKDKPRTRLDPNPRRRLRFETRQIIRQCRTHGRMDRAQAIARSEREHTSKSPWIMTSVKKLMPLARQIAGKPLNEAMIQMRFSKKLAAKAVLKHLEYARNEAIVRRNMGLREPIPLPKAPGQKDEEPGYEEDIHTHVVDRKGQKRLVTDRSAIYVDQAWVGRGTFGEDIDYRARGRAYRLRKPKTSISVTLKEERTRIRETREKEEKRQRKKPWIPLPDRPVTAQRQFLLW